MNIKRQRNDKILNLIHFNENQQISSRTYDLWTIEEFENLETKEEINLFEFFVGYSLVLCHNHGIAFGNFKEQLREKIFDATSRKDNNSIDYFMSIKIDSILFDKNNKQIPIDLIFSKEHLDFFLNTYKIMKAKD